jgi:uncharacterized protein (TIGR03382 family)
MTKLLAWLGAAMLMVMCAPHDLGAGYAHAQASEPLKPYVVFVLDTSGSMVNTGPNEGNPTGAGPPSCGGTDNRLNHAKCAINNIVNSYGDMVFALGRFRETPSGTFTSTCDGNGDGQGGGNDQCATSGLNNCAACNCNGANTACSASCTTSMRSDANFQLLTGLIEGSNELAGMLTDFSCSTCSLPAAGTAPTAVNEIWGTGSWTPLGGALLGAHRYWQGLQATDNTTIWPAAAGAAGGYNPIRNDPRTDFLPDGCDPNPATCGVGANPPCCTTQCRPYITILLTDGDETCGGNAPAAATQALNNTVLDNRRYRVVTKVIGMGITPGDPDIEAIAQAGSLTGNVPGVFEGFYASDEASLQLAISQILDDAIRTETCNNADDDCDNIADEGFSKGASCSNGRLGVCLVNGSTACRADGTGVECSAGIGPTPAVPPSTPACPGCGCQGRVLNQACTVVNAANTIVNGTCQAGAPQLVCIPTAATGPNPADPADNEIPTGCNNLDDDCDGIVDENVPGCSCTPQTEICDGDDDDCDGFIDENTNVACNNGTCLGQRVCTPTPGCNPSPTCTTGNCCLAPCNASTGGTEVCDGLDNNCDGNADGFTEACSNMFCPGGTCTGGTPPHQRTCVGGARNGLRCDTATPSFNPQNNPKAKPGSPCAALGAACVCNPGTRNCPLNGGGTFSACVAEIEPGVEICNNLDDDCDGMIDETPPVTCTTDAQCPSITPDCDNPSGMPNTGTCQPADCSINSCGGQLLCVNGTQTCTQQAGTDDTCNGVDEDCDMMVDEHWECDDPDGDDNIPGNADDCGCDEVGQCNATESCQNGAVVCMGNPVAQESCNCNDDDCDGMTDEGALCGAGASCVNCQCAFACSPGEFPCPMGKICNAQNYCVADPCFGFTCPDVVGDKQICRPKASNPADKECVSACDPTVIQCGGLICYKPTGECRPDNCTTFPEYCGATENCINGNCVGNPCNGVACGVGEYCNGGQCYGSCANVDCPDGQRCRLGTCEANPCENGCPFGQACDDDSGMCVPDQCNIVTCPQGQWCNPSKNGGTCEDDPCQIFDISCAEGEVCKGGTCYDRNDFLPDAGVEQHVTTGGGGGCSTTGETSSVLVGLGLVWLLRRRRRDATAGGAL